MKEIQSNGYSLLSMHCNTLLQQVKDIQSNGYSLLSMHCNTLLQQVKEIQSNGYSLLSMHCNTLLQQVKEIQSNGYSLLSIDGAGQSALHYAARLGHKDIVRYLIASAPAAILDMVDTDKSVLLVIMIITFAGRRIMNVLKIKWFRSIDRVTNVDSVKNEVYWLEWKGNW